MPIRAYFEPCRSPLTRLHIPGGLTDANGITVTGPVLSGRMSVDEALVLSWIRSQQQQQQQQQTSALKSERSPP